MPDAEALGPLQLAWIGDAVWELHQRLRHGLKPGRSDALHKAVVADVRADAQSAALAWLEKPVSYTHLRAHETV